MKEGRTSSYNGLIFGLTTGFFGGSIQAFLISLPNEPPFATRWILIFVGYAVWFLVGFLIGAFNSPRSVRDPKQSPQIKYTFVYRMLNIIGWLLYRLIVGYFIGCIATVVFAIVGISPWFGLTRLVLDQDKSWLDTPLGYAMVSGTTASIYSGVSGGVFGALVTTRRSYSHRPALGWRVVRCSFTAYLFGFIFGSSLGWMRPDQAIVYICAVTSIPIGILAGILGGIWTDLRALRDS